MSTPDPTGVPSWLALLTVLSLLHAGCGPQARPSASHDGGAANADAAASVTKISDAALPVSEHDAAPLQLSDAAALDATVDGGNAACTVVKSVPPACSEAGPPVCGCDLKTYANACAASVVSSIAHAGPCSGDDCSQGGGMPLYGDGATTPTCAAGQEQWFIASKDPSVCCRAPVPGVCAQYRVDFGACANGFVPVCGCDRATYSNECKMTATSKLHDGYCTELDCAAIGGRAVFSTSQALGCHDDERVLSAIMHSSGAPLEAYSACCLPK